MDGSTVIGNTGGYSYHQDNRTSVMNSESMPSAEADYARNRTVEIMETLRNGKPGEADRMLGKAPPKYRKPPKYEEGSMAGPSDARTVDGEVEGKADGELVSQPEGKLEGKSGFKWFKGKFNVKGKADDGVVR